MLFWIIAFNVGLDERSMGEGLSVIVDVGIGFIVEQHHRLILGNDSDGSHQLLELVVKYPLVAGQVNLLASFDIIE